MSAAIHCPQFTELGIEVSQGTWTDCFIGAREQLINAGLARCGEFPGDPGRGKTIASYKGDGTPIRHCRRGSRDAGARQITRATKGRFRVSVTLPKDEGKARFDKICAEEDQKRARESEKRAQDLQSAESDRRVHLCLLDSVLFVLDVAPQRAFNMAPNDERALRAAVMRASLIVRNATFTRNAALERKMTLQARPRPVLRVIEGQRPA